MATEKSIQDLRELLKKNGELLQVTPQPKLNDILVHCCVEDVSWVKQHLFIPIEQKMKRKCYLSYRDGKDLGNDAVTAINSDIDSAANIILVISQDYVSYSWHNYYVKMAHRKAISEEIPLVVIFLGDVKKLVFPEFCQIQPYLIHHILVEWNKTLDGKAGEEFWKRHLTNKNMAAVEGKITARKEVVSFTIPKKVGFIHASVEKTNKSSFKAYRTTKEMEDMVHGQMIIKDDDESGSQMFTDFTKESGKIGSEYNDTDVSQCDTIQQDSKNTKDESRDSAIDLPNDDICNADSVEESEGSSSQSESEEMPLDDDMPQNTLRRSCHGSRGTKKRKNRTEEVCYSQYSSHGWPMLSHYCSEHTTGNKAGLRREGLIERECVKTQQEESVRREPIVEDVIQKSCKVVQTEQDLGSMFESLKFDS